MGRDPLSGFACSFACGGFCCRRFVVSAAPDTIREMYENAQARIVASEQLPYDWDVVTIAEMLVPLDTRTDQSRSYTCTHFDAERGLCGIYDRRPEMCSGYPHGRTCTHCGFTNGPKLLKAGVSPKMLTA